MSGPSPRPEFEIDAGAEDVFVEAHNGACGASAVGSGCAGGVRQVNEQIFRFNRPILREGNFNPGADRPARFDRTVKSGGRIQTSLNIAESSASSAVEEDAVEGIADAAAHGGEPLALGLATNGRRHDRRDGSAGRAGIAPQIGPIAVALDAEDILSYLVIDAGRTADEEARDGETTGCSYDAIRPIASAGSEPAIDPKIEASPVVDGSRQWWRTTWRR